MHSKPSRQREGHSKGRSNQQRQFCVQAAALIPASAQDGKQLAEQADALLDCDDRLLAEGDESGVGATIGRRRKASVFKASFSSAAMRSFSAAMTAACSDTVISRLSIRFARSANSLRGETRS